MTNTASLCELLRATVSKIMSANHQEGEPHPTGVTEDAKGNCLKAMSGGEHRLYPKNINGSCGRTCRNSGERVGWKRRSIRALIIICFSWVAAGSLENCFKSA